MIEEVNQRRMDGRGSLAFATFDKSNTTVLYDFYAIIKDSDARPQFVDLLLSRERACGRYCSAWIYSGLHPPIELSDEKIDSMY